MVAALAGCGGGGEGTATGTDSAGSTGGGSTTQTTQTSQVTTSGASNSDTQEPTTGGSISESVSDTSATQDPSNVSDTQTGTTTGDPTATDGTTAPVTNAASSDARNSAALAMSSGIPNRVRWIARVAPPITGSSMSLHAPSLLRTIPDAMQLARMPSAAYSTAMDRVSALSAPFDAV